MKAIAFSKYGSPDVLQLKEIETPRPKTDEILIKVYAASVNDWDWGLIWGKPFVIRVLFGILKPKKVKIPGVDVAGKVEAVGKNITLFKPGDEVFGDLSESGFGSFAEYVCAKENAVSIKPPEMSFDDAAALPHASMLAFQALIDKGKLKEGQKILINGAGGGVGTISLQLAKLHNIENITGVDSSDKQDMMLLMGYKNVIDYQAVDFTSTGERYDLILDVKTNRSIFKYVKALNKNGTYVTIGGSMRRILGAALLGGFISLFWKRSIIVLGLKPNKDLESLKKYYKEGYLKPVIDNKIYLLSEVPQALKYFGEAKHIGKIIIKVSKDSFSNV